jgi:hypothetical protein
LPESRHWKPAVKASAKGYNPPDHKEGTQRAVIRMENMVDRALIPDAVAFADLREEPLHLKVGVTAWDDYHARMAPFVASADASIRDSAIERICMAVFSAEPTSARRSNDEDSIARLRWLRNVVENTSTHYPDVNQAFLEHMVFHGDDQLLGEFSTISP